ncbi:MAG: hypothetical protein Q4P33_06680 [Flaviflexus sp.]|nr:hypothetical protein [Flaviflexus sp.]
MTMWRPVTGEIYRLDPHLFTPEIFQEFFATQRVLGRARAVDEHFELEIAVTGRRRRIAVLDDEGSVIPGMPLAELVDQMDAAFRKSQIALGSEIRYGDLDLGEVDIDVDDDVDILTRLAEQPSLQVASAQTPEDEDDEDEEEVDEAPVLILSDMVLAEVPALASSAKVSLAVMPHGHLRAAVASSGVDVRKRIFPRPVFLLTLTTQGPEGPKLVINVDNHRPVTWLWKEGQLPLLDWMEEEEAAREFADEQLGAGAVARRAILETEQASAAGVRRALLEGPHMGPAFFIQAMGLPPEIVDILEGRLGVDGLPGAEVFGSSSFRETMRDVIALEISGHGVAGPKMWKYYRKLYLDHPALMNAVASTQAAVGGTVFAGALRSGRGKASKWVAGIGAFLMVNAVSRVLTTQWIQEAMQRSEAAQKLAILAAEARSQREEIAAQERHPDRGRPQADNDASAKAKPTDNSGPDSSLPSGS